MSDDYSFDLMPAAIQDLDNIAQYISIELKAKESALKLLDEMETAIIGACAFPYAAPAVRDPLIRHKGYRKLIVNNYIIFYIPDDEMRILHVMRVVYFARDYLKEL